MGANKNGLKKKDRSLLVPFEYSSHHNNLQFNAFFFFFFTFLFSGFVRTNKRRDIFFSR